MTLDELKAKLRNIVGPNKYRHQNYANSVLLASDYKKIITGKGQESFLNHYRSRETEEEKSQRIKLTKSKTKGTCNKILAMFDKTLQVDVELENTTYKGAVSDATKSELLNQVSHFYGGESVKRFLDKKYKRRVAFDPNSFVVVDYVYPLGPDGKADTSKYAKSFPRVFISDKVLDYQYVNGLLQYVVVGWLVGDAWQLELFAPGIHIGCFQVKKGAVLPIGRVPDDSIVFSSSNSSTNADTSDIYNLYITKTSTTECPAKQWGYVENDEESGWVNMLDAAITDLLDLVNVKSDYDLVRVLNVYLQKIQRTKPCNHIEKGKGKCVDGILSTSNEKCHKCGGSGIQVHKSPQNIMLVHTSEDETKAPIALNDYIYYPSMPMDIVEHLDKLIKRLPSMISEDIFGVDVSQIGNQNVTATAVGNFYDNIYAVLALFTDHYSELYKFMVRIIAQNGNLDASELVVEHRFPRDFRLKSLEEILNTLKLAKESGAPGQVVNSIKLDAMSKTNASNPYQIKLYELNQRFRPFINLSDAERASLLSTLLPTDEYYILYYYLDEIIKNLEESNKSLYDLDAAQQKVLIDKEVVKFQEKALKSLPKSFNPSPVV